ncbi:MAG TPA: GNAT family N-acetyltransferase [Actinomycetota bacterium]|nr:GNAT family N-acetyltransferase [Actinomycetota bacterium]
MPNIVELAPGDERLALVYPVMRELRTELSEEVFRQRFETGARTGGYRIAALFEGDECRAAAGFRVLTNLLHGTHMYIDDLVTSSTHRSKSYGKALNDHLVELARSEGCTVVQLDSGVQRFRAHGFYLREGYIISSHHFLLDL